MSPSSDVLRSFLEHPDRPAGTLGLEELQGFLFAVANAPELIVPSEWLPAVFGDSEPAFENGEEARTITTALMDEYNAVNDASLDSPDTLPPGCVIQDDPVANLEGRAPLSRWSSGFRQGHVWLEETWDEYLPDEDSELEREFTFVLIVLSFFSSRRMAEALCAETGANDVAAVAATMVEAFPAAVSQYVEIGRTMQGELTEASEPHRRAGPKIGRNEPCPCGSGRKYKRCCGAPA